MWKNNFVVQVQKKVKEKAKLNDWKKIKNIYKYKYIWNIYFLFIFLFYLFIYLFLLLFSGTQLRICVQVATPLTIYPKVALKLLKYQNVANKISKSCLLSRVFLF